MEQLRGLGLIPDIPSHLDFAEEHPEVAAILARTSLAPRVRFERDQGEIAAVRLPSEVDLRHSFSTVEDQGQLGSCTAHAAAALLEYFQRRALGHQNDLSRLFLYKMERNLLGLTGDTGGNLRTAMQALLMFGAPPEKYWPFDDRPEATNNRFDVEPPAFCYALAAKYAEYSHDFRYFRLDTDHRRKRCSSPSNRTWRTVSLARLGFRFIPNTTARCQAGSLLSRALRAASAAGMPTSRPVTMIPGGSATTSGHCSSAIPGEPTGGSVVTPGCRIGTSPRASPLTGGRCSRHNGSIPACLVDLSG